MRDLAELLEQLRQEGFDRSFDGDIEHLSSGREPNDQNAGSVRLVDVVQLDAGTDPGDDVTAFLFMRFSLYMTQNVQSAIFTAG